MVKRYGTSSMECENGIYVLHAEYEALEAEVRALREDAERYRWAIAYEDNSETLLAAVMNNAPDKTAISAEIDAARAKEKA
jgi:hypothetical protein